MKFVRNLLVIITMFVILSQNIIECSNKSQRSKSHAKVSRRSHTKTAAVPTFADILLVMDKVFTKSKTSILYFILGILSEFIPAIDKAITKLTELDKRTQVVNKFLPCFDKFTPTKEQNLDNSPFSGIEATTGTKKNSSKFCEGFKKDIQNYYVAAKMENYDNNANPVQDFFTSDAYKKAKYYVGGKFASEKKFCTKPRTSEAPNLQKKLKKLFGSIAEYETECLYFHGKNCDDFNPQAQGVKNFAAKAYSFVTGIKDVGVCILKIFGKSAADEVLEQAKDIIGEYFKTEDFLDAAMANVYGLVANVLTFGLWGGVKGGYYIVKLVDKVKNFKEAVEKALASTAFELGKIVGNCIMIVKAFVLGRRRKMMRRKFK